MQISQNIWVFPCKIFLKVLPLQSIRDLGLINEQTIIQTNRYGNNDIEKDPNGHDEGAIGRHLDGSILVRSFKNVFREVELLAVP